MSALFVLLIIDCSVSHPEEWHFGIENNEILYSSINPQDGYYPNIGNGFIAKNVGCYKNTSESEMNNYNSQIGATPCGSLYMNGIFNGNLSSYVHRARIPGIFSYYVETHPSDKDYNITWLGAALDMKNGIVYNQSLIYHPIKCKNSIIIQTSQYIHRKYTFLLVYNISIINNNLSSSRSIECQIPFSNCNSNKTNDFKWNQYQTFNKEINETIHLRNMQTLIPTFVNATLPYVCVAYQSMQNSVILTDTNRSKSYYGVFHSSLPVDTNISNQSNLTLFCENELINTLSMNEETVLNQHEMEMNKLWNIRIDMTGNDTIMNSVHSSLYYLFVSLNDDYPLGISADGLTSNGYRGTSFWDQNTWVSPSFMLLYPNISIYSSAEYRLNGIYGAMDWLNYCINIKKIYNYTFDNNISVQYPWTTAYTGQNTCPLYEGFAYYEQHINSDIGLEIKHLFYSTYNKDWFFQMKSQEPQTTNPRFTKYSHWNQTNFICNFWSNRFELNQFNKYTINEIVEPDERGGVRNSGIYTNTGAAQMLQFCIYIIDNYSHKIGNNINYNKLKIKWHNIVNNVYINITNKLTNDARFYIHSLYDGYNGQNINQADAVMLIYPLGYYLDDKYELFIVNDTINNILYNDLIYYTSKNGASNPSNTNPFYTGDSSYSISWLKLNNTLYNKQSQYFFNYGLHHMDNTFFYIWIEEYNAANGGHLNFMTGAGTFMQNIVFGYGGMHITKNALYINPILPYSGNVTNIKFNHLQYKSVEFIFEFNNERMSFQTIHQKTLHLYVETLIIDYLNKNMSVNQTYIVSTNSLSLQRQQVRLTVL